MHPVQGTRNDAAFTQAELSHWQTKAFSYLEIEVNRNPFTNRTTTERVGGSASAATEWTVWGRDGTRYTFGGIPQTVQLHLEVNPNSCWYEKPWRYELRQVQDPFGNVTNITYFQDGRLIELPQDGGCPNWYVRPPTRRPFPGAGIRPTMPSATGHSSSWLSLPPGPAGWLPASRCALAYRTTAIPIILRCSRPRCWTTSWSRATTAADRPQPDTQAVRV